MNGGYYNYSFETARGSWARRRFLHRWWELYAGDLLWPPPDYCALRRAIDPGRNSHLARLEPLFVSAEALERPHPARRGVSSFSLTESLPLGFMGEKTVATGAALIDPLRTDRVAYLTLTRTVNDLESLERLLYALAEELTLRGVRELIGPGELSPHLETGILLDCWDRLPPLFTPYNPPYLPELLERLMAPRLDLRLYHLPVKDFYPSQTASDAQAEIRPLELHDLAGPLLPLVQQTSPLASGPAPLWPPPDALEIDYILRCLQAGGPAAHLAGWVAWFEGQPAGYLLSGADLAPLYLRTGGGRKLPGRAALTLAKRFPRLAGARRMRIYLGGVLPERRGRGLAGLLLERAATRACARGWETLICGPFPGESAAARSLLKHGARAVQRYRVYSWSL